MKTYFIKNETTGKWETKHEAADQKSSNGRHRKLGNNATKLDALKASIERGAKLC